MIPRRITRSGSRVCGNGSLGPGDHWAGWSGATGSLGLGRRPSKYFLIVSLHEKDWETEKAGS